MIRVLRRVLPALLALLIVGLAAAPAAAHASLVSSDPAEGAVLAEAPETVTLTYDEPVSVLDDGVRVFDASGEDLDADAAARDEVVTADLPDGLDDGTYVVAWRVVSADGHPIAGSITFHVGAPSEAVVAPQDEAPDDGALRALRSAVQSASYVALLLAGGLVVFVGWTARGVRLRPEVRRRLVRLLRGAAGAAVAGTALAVPLSGAYQRGSGLVGVVETGSYDPALVGDDLTVLILQAVGLGLAAVLAGRPTPSVAADLGAVLAVGSPALVGHTRAYEPVSLLVVTDALHLGAGAIWFGGLVGLALTLPSLAGRGRDGALLLSRFSTLAAGALAVLAGAGVLLGWRILGSWSGLVDTTYGRLLLVKVGIAAVVAGVAAWNRYRLLPRVAGGHDQRRSATYGVRRAVAAESLLLLGLLGVTGFLVEQAPRSDEGVPSAATGGTAVASASAGDHRVLAVLDGGSGRQRQLTVQIQDSTGEPVDLLAAPDVALRSAEVDLGRVRVRPVAAGTYVADVTFPATGEWDVQVSLRVGELEKPVTTVTVEVR